MNDVEQILTELEVEKRQLQYELEGALTDKQRIDREVNSLHEKISTIYDTIEQVKRKFNDKPPSYKTFTDLSLGR
jgi:archaellum component FlaC